jgi:hypothetical protein
MNFMDLAGANTSTIQFHRSQNPHELHQYILLRVFH